MCLPDSAFDAVEDHHRPAGPWNLGHLQGLPERAGTVRVGHGLALAVGPRAALDGVTQHRRLAYAARNGPAGNRSTGTAKVVSGSVGPQRASAKGMTARNGHGTSYVSSPAVTYPSSEATPQSPASASTYETAAPVTVGAVSKRHDVGNAVSAA